MYLEKILFASLELIGKDSRVRIRIQSQDVGREKKTQWKIGVG